MVQTLTIDSFLQAPGPILDVRSPGEFEQGHIPGAVSFPLLSNEERAQVGICYKQAGRDAAVELGFDLIGPKLGNFVRTAKALAPNRQVRVHCWRGGMRSGGVGWGLAMAGFEVVTLEGGYKAFRRWARQVFTTPRSLRVLGGMTGTGKTEILQALVTQGHQMVDFEALANHRGSSFGNLQLPPQPSTEQFENLLAMELAELDHNRPVWVEAESRRVGTCRIPEELFLQMEAAPTLEIVRSLSERYQIIFNIYGQADRDEMIQATQRIRKRLGGQRTQAAITHIQQGNFRIAFEIILDYYDRTYRYDLERRGKVIPQVDVSGLTPDQAAKQLVRVAALIEHPETAGETLVNRCRE